MPLPEGMSRDDAKSYNRRARQLFWRGAVSQTYPVWSMTDDELCDWIADYQSAHGLLADGKLGVSTMIVMMGESLGGLGDIIIGGNEVHIEGLRVVRMFKPDAGLADVKPDLCCILSQPELDRAVRERLDALSQNRAHFSIDSSIGTANESLIIQWADPLKAVSFCPAKVTDNYPVMRQCIGVEFENALLGFQLDSDERRWDKRRPYVRAQLGNVVIRQPALYDEQIAAFERLKKVLVEKCGIADTFPRGDDGSFVTHELSCETLSQTCGFVARFHYAQQNNEPGVGFVVHLERLFGPSDAAVHHDKTSEKREDSQKGTDLAAPSHSVARSTQCPDEKLPQETLESTPTTTYSPHIEEDPRFSLSAAIAAAWQSGKAARGARMAERMRHFDND